MTRPLLSYLSPLLACAVACAVACAACGGMVGCEQGAKDVLLPDRGEVLAKRVEGGRFYLTLRANSMYGAYLSNPVTSETYNQIKVGDYYVGTLPAESIPTPSGKGGAE